MRYKNIENKRQNDLFKQQSKHGSIKSVLHQ